MFDSIIQYPMGADYALALINAMRDNRKLYDQHIITRKEFEDYLARHRRDDNTVHIPPSEIPTRIRYERANSGNLTQTGDGVKGGFLIGRITLEWLNQDGYFRESGPARVEMDQYRVRFFRGEVHGKGAVACSSVHCQWWRDNRVEVRKPRVDGPYAVKLFSFKMDRINNQYGNPRARADHQWMKWTPTRGGLVVKNDIFREIVKSQKLIICPFSVHKPVFLDVMNEYLFWEEAKRLEQKGVEVYTK